MESYTVDWIELVHDWIQWWTPVNMLINLCGSVITWEFIS
jgi:hypothetical protein